MTVVVQSTATSILPRQKHQATQVLSKAMKSAFSTYDANFLERKKLHVINAREHHAEPADELLYSYFYYIRRQWELENTGLHVFRPNQMSYFSSMANKVLKPGGLIRKCGSTLRDSVWWRELKPLKEKYNCEQWRKIWNFGTVWGII